MPDHHGPTPPAGEPGDRMHPEPSSSGARTPREWATFSRRAALGLVGASAIVGAGTGVAVTGRFSHPPEGVDGQRIPFRDRHQGGIATPAQERLHFAAFDLTSPSRADLVALLRAWTDAAEAMCAGREVGEGGAVGGPVRAAPTDTGEAIGLHPARLTLTIGFGPSLFTTADGIDRYRLAERRPVALADLPPFPGDKLDPTRCGGDLCLQACADDPQVAVHAIRGLARIARGTAVVRYSQLGFGRTASTSINQDTPRNLMGFKDGTRNVKGEDTHALDRHVWVQPGDGPEWMTGGSYLVARRIRMLIEPWDSTPLAEQERVIGRQKGSGAPIGAVAEFDPPDLAGVGAGGTPLLDLNSHIRLAHPASNGGAMLLRRGYSFVDGTDELGRLDAGLFFLAYQRDPRTQFTAINNRLAGKHRDNLNEYIQHVGSGVFACPPGLSDGAYWGQSLLDG